MKRISLSSIILFALCVFFIMQYRLSPGETPFLLFGLIFLLLGGYIIVDLLNFSQKKYDLIKNSVLEVTILIVLGSAFYSSMIVRHQTSPEYGVHDIVLQQEQAVRFLLHGKNPYSTTYFGTPMEKWHYSDTEVNPALYHFVMEPFYVILPIPFYLMSNHTIGFFDSREVLWLLFGLTLVVAYLIPKEQENKRILITLLAFNPATLGYLLEGRSDFFAYFFLLLGLLFLQKKNFVWAGILVALSFCVKQSTWPFIPLYFLYIWISSDTKNVFHKTILFLKYIFPFILLSATIILPFYLWNPKAFLDSTVYYLSGNTQHSYPVSGYGFGMILHQMNIIKNVHDYFPFQTLQIVFGLPTLLLVSFYLIKAPSVQRLIICYALFLFVFWYFARYFNNSHVGYLSMLFITAYLWPNKND